MATMFSSKLYVADILSVSDKYKGFITDGLAIALVLHYRQVFEIAVMSNGHYWLLV